MWEVMYSLPFQRSYDTLEKIRAEVHRLKEMPPGARRQMALAVHGANVSTLLYVVYCM